MNYQTYEELFERITQSPATRSETIIVNVNSHENYTNLVNNFLEKKQVQLSNYVKGDQYPDLLQCYAEIEKSENTTLVYGFSQHMMMISEKERREIWSNILNNIKLSTTPQHRVIFLFYQMEDVLAKKIYDDLRLNERIFLLKDVRSDPTGNVFLISNSVEVESSNSERIFSGYNQYLQEVEINPATNITVVTKFTHDPYSERLIQVTLIPSAYKYLVVKKQFPKSIPESVGTADNWLTLVKDIKGIASVTTYFSSIFKGQMSKSLLGEWNDLESPQKKWYAWLHMKLLSLKDINYTSCFEEYIQYVLSLSNSVDKLIHEYYFGILKISPNDPCYQTYYNERKKGLKDLNNNLILSEYCEEVSHYGETMIYYLTDTSDYEKKLILEWISGKTSFDSETLGLIKLTYPDLWIYLKEYSVPLDISDHNIYTKYFQAYKEQKVQNRLDPLFCKEVNTIANVKEGERPYYSLSTREAAFEKLDVQNTPVYFIDCLGAEYLSFIEAFCDKNKLSCSVQLVTAKFPTETEYNTEFRNKKGMDLTEMRELDQLKHKGIETYSGDNPILPYYLIKELDILRKYLNSILQTVQKNQKVVIVTDHGSSRLCVLSKQSCDNDYSYDGDAKNAKRRYCENMSGDISNPHLLRDGNYCVWANYNQFTVRGPPPKWELHGGATIEEVVIPLIEISKDNTKIKLICKTNEIKLKVDQIPIVEFVTIPKCQSVVFVVEKETYSCNTSDNGSEWICVLPKNIKTGTYTGIVRTNEKNVGELSFSITKGLKKKSFDL
ncbi:BREX-4 system phosphatase PglZ [Methanoplanus endosymbiosus]|uniref:BREX-4 system phosphatase PglZ n=1 Tax=Methanoplanus endosymbiosus TaxID=33865 RepID=A0A9E7PLZ6_9EURY|nr:BREX-4 system phosphatase PglZ [Methanoplanus endosymbiosus]UUX91404.1 BREX-4 system phosphatase PglZ [Methanoplanus endosymbiosus]